MKHYLEKNFFENCIFIFFDELVKQKRYSKNEKTN